MRKEALRMEQVTHKADDIELLSNFNLNIFQGEIMGLLSLDGHGKSELIQLLIENPPLYYGRVFLMNQLVNSHRRASSSHNNVAVIDKKHRLVESLTVSDNIFVVRKGFGKFLVNRKTLSEQTRIYAEQFCAKLDADRTVKRLPAFERCVVEIIRAKVAGVRLLIVEDMSNIVGAKDLIRLHGALKRFAEDGSSVLYICAHHEECLAVCDRIALMEKGKIISVMDKEGFNEELIRHYCLDFSHFHTHLPSRKDADPVLTFENVYTSRLNGLGFSIKKGECAAMLDIDHSAFEDMIKLISGESAPDIGGVMLEGKDIMSFKKKYKPVEFISDNPTSKMLFPELSYLDNLCYLLGEKKPVVWRNNNIKKSIAREYSSMIGNEIYEQNIRSLSIEALYKLVYYRVHLANPRLVICLQPFFGADMYLRHHILRLIKALLNKGISVLMLLTNISDSLSAVNRLIVVSKGKVLREYNEDEFYKLDNKANLPQSLRQSFPRKLMIENYRENY